MSHSDAVYVPSCRVQDGKVDYVCGAQSAGGRVHTRDPLGQPSVCSARKGHRRINYACGLKSKGAEVLQDPVTLPGRQRSPKVPRQAIKDVLASIVKPRGLSIVKPGGLSDATCDASKHRAGVIDYVCGPKSAGGVVVPPACQPAVERVVAKLEPQKKIRHNGVAALVKPKGRANDAYPQIIHQAGALGQKDEPNLVHVQPRHLPTRGNIELPGKRQRTMPVNPKQFSLRTAGIKDPFQPNRTFMRRPRDLPFDIPTRAEWARPKPDRMTTNDNWRASRIPNRPESASAYRHFRRHPPDTLPVQLPQELIDQTMLLVREVGLLKQEMQGVNRN